MGSKRKAISKSVRFEVFKRDGYTCQYCGKKPPETTLEIDHIIPVSKGGDGRVSNLITACYDCNRGKSDRALEDKIPDAFTENELARAQELLERKAALRRLKRIENQIRRIDEANMKECLEVWNGWTFGRNGLIAPISEGYEPHLARFIERLGAVEVCKSMRTALGKIGIDIGERWRYFCGVCWSKIKTGTD